MVTPPPDATAGNKTQPIKIHGITVEDVDFDSIAKQAPPNFMRMRIEGIAVDNKPAEGVDLKEMAGIDKLLVDFQFDYRIDPDKKTLTLSRLEMNLNGLARLELSMILDNFTADERGAARQGDERHDIAHRQPGLRRPFAAGEGHAGRVEGRGRRAVGLHRDGQGLPRRAAQRPGRTDRRRRSTRSNPTCRITPRRKARCA